MSKSVIIDAVRSPIGVKNGNMVGIRPDDLAAQVIKGLLARNENISPDKIEDFILGCAFPEGPQGMLMAKGVSILSGIPETVGGAVVNRFCGSSMDAVHQISNKIESGDIEVGIASGVEDMFSVPMGGFNPDFHPELAEQEYYIGMGETAETLA
ncbi:MAG: thiolase family protein, partial [Fidelibacterota bacterium]